MRIDANLAHQIVLDWLRDIASNGERFQRLHEEGVRRIENRVAELRKAFTKIDTEQTSLLTQIDARIDELTRCSAESVRRSIETSITRLENTKEEKRQQRLYIEHEIRQLEAASTATDLFSCYQNAIQKGMRLVGEDRQDDEAKIAFKGLLASLTLQETGIKIALSGGVNRKALGSTLFVVTPPHGRSANGRIALIQDIIRLPNRFHVLQVDELRKLYCGKGLSVREIARKAGVSHSTVLAHLRRHGIKIRERDLPRKRKGQVPFGWEYRSYKLVKNPDEQRIIRMIRQYASVGKSFRGIARELNGSLIPTKNNGIWQANTVRKILDRTRA